MNKKLLILFVIAFGLALPAAARASFSFSGLSAFPPASTCGDFEYTVSGQINLDDLVSSPLPGVEVSLYEVEESTLLVSAQTDQDGYYEFLCVGAGSYEIVPALPGYSFSPPSIFLIIENAGSGDHNFSASAAEETYSISGLVVDNALEPLSGAKISFTSEPPGSFDLSGESGVLSSFDISGVVTRENMQPLPGTRIAYARNTPAGEVFTDEQGAYIIPGLNQGTYTLTPSKAEYDFTPASAEVTVNASLGNGNANFSAAPKTYLISGRVAGPGGGGVSGVLLSLDTGQTQLSGADGLYEFTNLPAGSYTVSASLPHYTFEPPSQTALVGGGQDALNINFTASLREYTVSGRVVYFQGDQKQPLPGVLVQPAAGESATSASNGAFELLLKAGAHSLTLSKPEFTFSNPVTFQLSGDLNLGDLTGVQITYAFSVKVMDEDGSPLPEAEVLYSGPASGALLYDEASESFRVSGLSAGTYTLTPALDEYEFEPPARALVLANGTISPQPVPPFVGQALLYQITGQVLDQDQNPLENVVVRYTKNSTSGAVETDAEGRYRIPSVGAGTYTISAEKDEYEFQPLTAQVIVGKSAGNGEQDFVGSPKKYILGGAVYAGVGSGKYTTPAQGVLVKVLDTSEQTQTAANGGYSFSLPAGEYTLVVEQAGFTVTPVQIQVELRSNTSGKDFYITFVQNLPLLFSPPDSLIYRDDFTRDNGWQPVYNGSGSVYFDSERYVLHHNDANQFMASLMPSAYAAAPTPNGYSVQATITKGAGDRIRCGLVFDWVSNADFTYFVIRPEDGTWAVYRYASGYTLLGSGGSASIRPNLEPNTLKVVRTQSEIILYANGIEIGRLSQPRTGPGTVGLQLTVYSSTPGVAYFDNFEYRRVP